MKNIKNIKYNNYYIIFGLIVLFLVVLNYNNLTNFFKIKEGAEGEERTSEVVSGEIVEMKKNIFTDTQIGSTEEKTLKEYLSDPELRGKMMSLFNLNLEFITKQKHDNYSDFKEEMEKTKYTPLKFKQQILGHMPFVASVGLFMKVLKDNKVDLFSESNSLGSMSEAQDTLDKVKMF
jgi:hypothetical protein